MNFIKRLSLLLIITLLPTIGMTANHMASDRISDIRNTKHNFAASDLVTLPNGDQRDVKAVSENQVCVFCHTPHGKPGSGAFETNMEAPFLWNRSASAATYDKYASSSMQAVVGLPGEGSKMCLSCHDGTVAVGQVDVLNGRLGSEVGNIAMTGNDGTTGGILSTSNSNLGTDLKNDHPIGFTYDSALANHADENELIDPAASEGDHIGIRIGAGVANFNQSLTATQTPGSGNFTTANTHVSVPLESVASLRASGQTTFVNNSATGSVECTTCHDPHIRSSNNSENIKFLRLHRFQKSAITVGSFAIDSDIMCLACHKKAGWAESSHAVETSETYTYTDAAADEREFPLGTHMWQASCLNCHDTHSDTGARWLLRKATDGSGNSEIENTCFQCHTGTNSVLDSSATVKDIETANLLGGEHTASDFDSNTDLHNVTNSESQESQANLQTNRHVTCSDCHNPHRTLTNTLANGTGSTDSALHVHADGVAHNNLLSGALSGTSGVEPDFSGEVAGFNPHVAASGITYTEKFGAADSVDAVQKEYQVCLKCHSNWGINETTGIGVDPLKANTAAEFGSNAVSYHPVINSTDDNANAANKANTAETNDANYIAPFNTAVGTQTMYCSDCHTSDVSGTQGPHGASGLLKSSGDNLCLDCHEATQYQNATGIAQNSGFSCTDGDNTDCVQPTADGNANNLHVFHASNAGTGVNNKCTDCHVKIPHGWRNKSLLVDIGEADTGNLQARYYPSGILNINTMSASGAWKKADCTAAGCH